MNRNLDVDRWFAEIKHPLEASMRRVREVILAADPRMTEIVKYRTTTFAYESDLASFVQMNKKHITLMFNTGARIPGRFPHLEGDGPNARFMRFADLAEVEARTAELQAIVVAWCALKSTASGSAEAAGKPARAPAAKAAVKARPAPATRAKPALKAKVTAKAQRATSAKARAPSGGRKGR